MTSPLLERTLDTPPLFVQLAAHPLRWRLLRELSGSDRTVKELTARLGEPQSLISYHLRRLREGGLVSARRSAADGRDSYYAIDFLQCESQLQAVGPALHEAIVLEKRSPDVHLVWAGGRRRVLFLCTGNSARSQMAEALLGRMTGGTLEVASAGSHPKPLHPNAVRVMRDRGIDISGNRTKSLVEFVSQPIDVVVTLCDRVREVCPAFPSGPDLVHWSLPDPAQVDPSDHASYPAFERTATEIEVRLRFFTPVLCR